MGDNDVPTRAKQLVGDFAPKLVSLTDDAWLLIVRRAAVPPSIGLVRSEFRERRA